MKAPSSDASNDDGAEKDNSDDSDEELVFDYRDFFSVLMYYGHMSKSEIMDHSRAFLHGIYRMYVKRACENLGVSSTQKKDDDDNDSEDGYDIAGGRVSPYELTADDYPTSFTKMPPRKKRNIIESSPEKTRDFLAAFGGGAQVFKDVQIAEDT